MNHRLALDDLAFARCASCQGRGFTARGYGLEATFHRCAKCGGAGQSYLRPVVDRSKLSQKGGLSLTELPMSSTCGECGRAPTLAGRCDFCAEDRVRGEAFARQYGMPF